MITYQNWYKTMTKLPAVEKVEYSFNSNKTQQEKLK